MLISLLIFSPVFGIVTAQDDEPSINGKIAFEREIDGKRQIFVINPDGSGEARLTNNSFDDANPVWSPDGTKIAFSSNRDGIWEIYVMGADGSSQINLTNGTGGANPGYSPDGTKIVFASDPSHTGGDEIYVMNSDGSGLTRLTYNSAYDFDPSYSPDGTSIVFMSDRDGNYEIYVMNADGSGQTRLTNNSSDDSRPSWSQDGTKIAFETRRDGYSQIYTMNPDGSEQTRITNTSHHCFNPFWSPDGTMIAFGSHRDGNHDIYIMNADGSSEIRVTDNSARDIWPSWQRLFITEFQQSGIGSDFTGNVISVDGVNYMVGELPVSFAWAAGTSHDFSWSSPLTVSSDKRYVWSSTSGPSTGQSGTFTAEPEEGLTPLIAASYAAQYYVTFAAQQGGSVSQASGWYDASSTINVTTTPSQGYAFTGWSALGNFSISSIGGNATITVNGAGSVSANFEGVDLTPPSIASTLPANGSTSTSGSVAISASYSDNVAIDPASAVLKVDGINVTSGATATATGIAYNTTLAAGSHSVELTVKDTSGNPRTATWTFSVPQPASGFPMEYIIAIVAAVAVIAVLMFFLARRKKS